MFKSASQRRDVLYYVFLASTLFLCLFWLLPLFTLEWNMKHWYVLAGLAADVRMEFGIFKYTISVDCANIIRSKLAQFEALKDFCLEEQQLGTGVQLGTHSYLELKDFACNVHASSGRFFLFAGCEQVKLLAFITYAAATVLVVSLLMMLITLGLLRVYLQGYGQERLITTLRGLHVVALVLQFFALAGYGIGTSNMSKYFDTGVLFKLLPFGGLAFGSSRNVFISYGLSFFGAICAHFLGVLTTVPLQYIRRTPKQDAEADPYEQCDDPTRALNMYYAQQEGAYGATEGQPAYGGAPHFAGQYGAPYGTA